MIEEMVLNLFFIEKYKQVGCAAKAISQYSYMFPEAA